MRAGLADAFAAQTAIDIVERYRGNTSTDYWGIPHVASETEREVLPADALERRLALLEAAWAYFDDVAATVSPPTCGPVRAGRLDPRRDHPPRVRQRAGAVHAQGRGPDAA